MYAIYVCIQSYITDPVQCAELLLLDNMRKAYSKFELEVSLKRTKPTFFFFILTYIKGQTYKSFQYFKMFFSLKSFQFDII